LIYFESPTVFVAWDEECWAVLATVRQGATLVDFQTSSNKGLELLILKGSQQWLADLRLQPPPALEYTEWHVKHWRPRARAAGLKRVAVVVAQDTLLPTFLHRLNTEKREGDAQVAYFRHLDDARAWLRVYRHD
jgi:hypothetical protein